MGRPAPLPDPYKAGSCPVCGKLATASAAGEPSIVLCEHGHAWKRPDPPRAGILAAILAEARRVGVKAADVAKRGVAYTAAWRLLNGRTKRAAPATLDAFAEAAGLRIVPVDRATGRDLSQPATPVVLHWIPDATTPDHFQVAYGRRRHYILIRLGDGWHARAFRCYASTIAGAKPEAGACLGTLERAQTWCQVLEDEA